MGGIINTVYISVCISPVQCVQPRSPARALKETQTDHMCFSGKYRCWLWTIATNHTSSGKSTFPTNPTYFPIYFSI